MPDESAGWFVVDAGRPPDDPGAPGASVVCAFTAGVHRAGAAVHRSCDAVDGRAECCTTVRARRYAALWLGAFVAAPRRATRGPRRVDTETGLTIARPRRIITRSELHLLRRSRVR